MSSNPRQDSELTDLAPRDAQAADLVGGAPDKGAAAAAAAAAGVKSDAAAAGVKARAERRVDSGPGPSITKKAAVRSATRA